MKTNNKNTNLSITLFSNHAIVRRARIYEYMNNPYIHVTNAHTVQQEKDYSDARPRRVKHILTKFVQEMAFYEASYSIKVIYKSDHELED